MKYKKTSRISTIHKLLLAVAGLALAAAVPAQAAETSSRALLLQGDRYASQGKWDAARVAYVRALEAGAVLDQDYLRCRNLGRAYLNGKSLDNAEAAKWLARALRLRPSSQDIRPLLARAAAAAGDHKTAAEQYGFLAKAQPANSKYLLAWADSLLRIGQPEQATAAVQVYMEKHPADTATRLGFAQMLTYERRDFDEAIRQYQTVLQADPNNVTAQVGVAKVMSWQDKLDIALELYDKVLARNPQNYDALVGKAFTLMWMERKSEARELFEVAASRNPRDREVASALRTLESPAPATAAAPPPPPPAPVTPPEKAFIDTLMAAGAAASARGNYVDAIHEYHRVLERDPNYQPAKLQIARVLSWSHNYQASAEQYDDVLSSGPNNAGVRLEKARVLSWATLFPQSISEYERVLKDAAHDPAMNVDDVRLEYARVLSWAGRYDDALAQFDLLLPKGAAPEAKHKNILLEKAKALAYEKRFDQSITTYDQALAVAPGDQDVLLNKGQTLYWAGRLDEAAVTLQPLLQQPAKQPETSFVMAEVEAGRGNSGRALNLLKEAPQNDDAKKLHSSIRAGLRPVLHLRFGWEDDQEISALGPTHDTTYRALRYTAGVEFFAHPNVHVEIFNTVTDTNTSNATIARHGIDGLATETMARFDFRINRWLRMIAGAGGGTSGAGCDHVIVAFVPLSSACANAGGVQSNRQQQFLYELHPVITHGDFRLDIASTRRLAEYTSLAVHDNVVFRRESIAATYFWRKRVTFGGEYFHGAYSLDSPDVTLVTRQFEVASNGGAVFVRPVVYRNDRVIVEAGFRLDTFAFDDRVVPMVKALGSGGFFAPRRYERYAGTGHIGWDPNARVHIDFNGSVGPQRVTGFAALSPPPAVFGISGNGGAEIMLKLGRWQPYAGYYFYSSSSPSSVTSPSPANGAFQSQTFFVGLRLRF